MQYDDLYRRMHFSTNCKLGTDSQFISHQTLHRPDPTPTPPRPPPRKTSRPVLNPETGKQVCYNFPVNMIMFASNCIGWEPTHNGSTSLLLLKNHILSPHSTADLPPSCILTTELAGVVTITLLNSGTDPVLRTPLPVECGESLPIHAGPFSEFKQQPQAAKVSTDLVCEA